MSFTQTFTYTMMKLIYSLVTVSLERPLERAHTFHCDEVHTVKENRLKQTFHL